MNVNGKLHEITNAPLFISSFSNNPAHPNPASFKPMAEAQVFLGTDFPAGFTNSFIPGFSFQATTDANGAFSIFVPDGFPQTIKAYLLATHTIMKVLPPLNVPIFAPVYRSETFQFSQINSKTQDIYVLRTDGTTKEGFSQAQISSMTTDIQQKMKLESLSAFINDGSVGIVGKSKGATLKADLFLSPFTGPDLNTFISEKVDNIDIDLPGPDFIVGLFVSKDEIAKQFRQGIHNMMPTLNKQIFDRIQKQLGMLISDLEKSTNSKVTITFEKLRFPVVETKIIGPFSIKVRAIVPDLFVGIARKLFS
ncbi:hypothetical protein Back11_00150 [Paenibacillus baekrokdamisoli]|uniref:Uncharacterized protein n=1 Tax=Paenibacillus baekrokdamisoli TaxID=1712516 RepID=A0A3G9II73_9BACL|nr:hypothetical protein [Paenibacillus baekrokdamisoli]MBB3069362.1 hypothetical protein [Paenibacillus baekrokdamisoli]BBH18670.1 hypothetical protein Back11_00150 [Paenibacillus baekrokdamisoli]